MALTKSRIFFCIGSFLGKVLTMDLIQRRGWSLVNRCFLSKEDEELVNRILLHLSKLDCYRVWCYPFSGLCG